MSDSQRLENKAAQMCADPSNPNPQELAAHLDRLLREDSTSYTKAVAEQEAEVARIERRDDPDLAKAQRVAASEDERAQAEAEARWLEQDPELFSEPGKRTQPRPETVRRARQLMAEAARIYASEGHQLLHGNLLHESVLPESFSEAEEDQLVRGPLLGGRHA